MIRKFCVIKRSQGVKRWRNWREVSALKSSVVRVGVLAHYATSFSGNLNLVRTFFTHVAEDLSVPDQAALADYALHLNRPYVAIKIAQQAAFKRGYFNAGVFPGDRFGQAGRADSARAGFYSIARRESELDPTARSHAKRARVNAGFALNGKARGAAIGAGLFGEKTVQLIGGIMRGLASAYLGEVIGRFDGSYVLGFAAYNAGPNRVKQWVEEYGNPHKKGADFGNDIVDWIEHIPYRETRNYVMRVMESVHVYRARLKGRTPKLSVVRGFATRILTINTHPLKTI